MANGSIKIKKKTENENLGESMSVDSDSESTQQSGGISKTYKRNMTGKKEVFTDLFKLMTATVIKYEGWEKEGIEHPDSHPAKFSHWEHTHPFRTYDRKGDRMKTSTPIGGHFHLVEWADSPNPDEPPVIKSISGPMVMQKKIVRGKQTQIAVPANDYDDHTHDVEYIRSGKIEFTATNIEATKVVAFESSKTAPIQGVTER